MSIAKENTGVTLIPLQFGLFWSGGPLSYLRYLTLVTLRKYHPKSKIELYVSSNYSDNVKWKFEKQDFQNIDENSKDYLDKVPDLNISILEFQSFEDFPPNYQSDFFRWWYLKNNGGFYLDLDQIIMKSFHSLPLENDFIFSMYPAQSCKIYAPVGVIGSKKNSLLLNEVYELISKYEDLNSYNSLGPNMFKSVFTSKKWPEKLFNAPSSHFYPVHESYLVDGLYDGSVDLSSFKNTWACHWFGGSPKSQEFNKKYTEEFAKTSDDSISSFLRTKGII